MSGRRRCASIPTTWIASEAGYAHLAGETPAYDVEFRLLMPGGGCRWFRQRGVALRDACGRAYRMAGSIEDITDRKLAEGALRESEARFRSLIKELSSD